MVEAEQNKSRGKKDHKQDNFVIQYGYKDGLEIERLKPEKLRIKM